MLLKTFWVAMAEQLVFGVGAGVDDGPGVGVGNTAGGVGTGVAGRIHAAEVVSFPEHEKGSPHESA